MEMSQIRVQFCYEKPKGRELLEELGIDGKIMLNIHLKENL